MKKSTILLKKALKIAEEITFEKAIEGKKFKNPQTGNDVVFSSLPADEQKKVRAEFDKKKKELDSQGGKGKGSLKSKEESLKALEAGEKDLSNADFSETDFKGLKRTGVCLEGANLSGSNLNDAQFKDCDFKGADLEGVKGEP
jgi:uncharacterized protein YjbI with pentapeptide repeats